jgi:hypothetical protein
MTERIRWTDESRTSTGYVGEIWNTCGSFMLGVTRVAPPRTSPAETEEE